MTGALRVPTGALSSAESLSVFPTRSHGESGAIRGRVRPAGPPEGRGNRSVCLLQYSSN
jgi:ribosomal protein L35AE/L33A